MKKDIDIPEAAGVYMAIAKDSPSDWGIYIINRHSQDIEDAMVVTKGYGERSGEPVKTSTLRHYIGTLKVNQFAHVEMLDPSLLDLSHEFWLTFYINGKIHDMKFIFPEGSLSEENLSYIQELDKKGVLHI